MRRVSDPDIPVSKEPVPVTRRLSDILTPPVNAEPEIVATTESSILRVTSPELPPPVRPVPAVTEVISPTVPSFVITICPLEEDEIEIPAPAAR